MQDYYQILGVDEGADAEAIKKAYRDGARKYHPDLNPGDSVAEERFKEMSEAYAVLSDAKRRAEYDRARQAGAFSAGGFNLNDLFGGGGPEGLFEQVFGGGFGRTQRTRGEDYVTSIELPFRTAMLGGPYQVHIPLPVSCTSCGGVGTQAGAATTCPTCHGQGMVEQLRGQMRFSQACSTCNGSGQRPGPICGQCHGQGWRLQHQDIRITIPPGIETGKKLRLAGKGYPGRHGGPPGNVLLAIEVQPDGELRRENNRIVLRLPVPASTAIQGGVVEVPTLDGTSDLKIPAGAQGGQKLRMREKGIPFSSGRGDQIVELRIVLPTGLTAEQVSTLQSWEEAEVKAD